MQPLKLYGGILGPNPLKVAIILGVLQLPYETEVIMPDQLKTPTYEAINPNGRLPSLYDPNTEITLWESGAIIEYLIERYDTEEPRKLSFPPGSADAEHARQWLYFQTSGQGPYYGQGYWFMRHHAEKVPSAIERYVNEAKRVTAVLDRWLAKQKQIYQDQPGDGPWLVGNRMSYADLAFISWQRTPRSTFVEAGFDVDSFPHEKDWFECMTSHEDVKAVLDASLKVTAALHK
jgi:glutathione S-transferase